jgi:hypothetical protein
MQSMFSACCAALALAAMPFAAGAASVDELALQLELQPAAQGDLTGAALAFELTCCSNPYGWDRVASASLGLMRGGFSTPAGLQLSLGIERLVTINGELVSHTNFQIADIGRISGAEALRARDAVQAMNLVQRGDHNLVGGELAARSGTFVQNSLNDQLIRSQTIISSSVNSLSMLKDLNFNGGVHDAVVNAIGTR